MSEEDINKLLWTTKAFSYVERNFKGYTTVQCWEYSERLCKWYYDSYSIDELEDVLNNL